GDLANFVIGCSLVLPASIIYMFKKTRKNAVLACLAGSLVMTVFGTAFNGVYLLPAFSKLFGMPLEAIIAAGAEINGNINSITSFVCFAVAPINIIKSVAASAVTLVIYKPLSPILKHAHVSAGRKVTDNVKNVTQ
ncbi:MAG: ECF transporter S component, partial [Lachnospiraceae bacterium]|nr:ECF transporter S component [Lachnospiraceae bacterium]